MSHYCNPISIAVHPASIVSSFPSICGCVRYDWSLRVLQLAQLSACIEEKNTLGWRQTICILSKLTMRLCTPLPCLCRKMTMSGIYGQTLILWLLMWHSRFHLKGLMAKTSLRGAIIHKFLRVILIMVSISPVYVPSSAQVWQQSMKLLVTKMDAWVSQTHYARAV